jgi:hypothetical protein
VFENRYWQFIDTGTVISPCTKLISLEANPARHCVSVSPLMVADWLDGCPASSEIATFVRWGTPQFSRRCWSYS